LSETERKHLILTGKNGSGKTSLLEAMSDSILHQQYEIARLNDLSNKLSDHMWSNYHEKLRKNKISGVSISYSQENIDFFDFFRYIFAYITAGRTQLNIPKAIEAVEILGKTVVAQNASKDFLKYILNLDYQLYGAQSNNNSVLEKNLKNWFDSFLSALRDIYNCQELVLQRDVKNLAFKIEMPGYEPFGLHEMADGYAAFLNIYMELLMRLESDEAVVEYEKPAIVLIDEIETHLHVELQKRVLPFLTKMFPNIQFIVATHSPFVMTSLENAVVYDLEKNERLEKPSFYSYKTIVESFLDTDMYSNQLKAYFERYKELCFRERTPEENIEFLRAKTELEIRSIPSTELYIAFQNLEERRKAARNDSSK
jgi:predicted ATP-dependent endonuclease of OLD family